MVGVSKLTPAKLQQHAVMLLQHYHKLCNTNNPSSIFVSPPPITNTESLSQSNISSLGSGSFGRNRYDVNSQQQTKSELSNTDTLMAYNEDLYPPPPQDILNVFAAVDLSSQSSSDSAKYKYAWHKAKIIRSSILSAGKFLDACSRSLSIALIHKEIASIMAVTSAIFPKNMPMQLTDMKKRKKMSHATSVGNKQKQTEDRNFFVISNIVSIGYEKSFFCLPFVLVYYRLMLHGTIFFLFC